MAKEITVLKVNPMKTHVGQAFEVKTIKDELDIYYKELNCSTIDIVSRKIGKKRFDIVCDDEGLYNNQIPTIFTPDGKVMIVGPVIICNHNTDGELESLTSNDILHIIFESDAITGHILDGDPNGINYLTLTANF